MAIENHGSARRLLARTLRSPDRSREEVDDLLALLAHDEPTLRVGAAWALCLVAASHPDLAADVRDRVAEYDATAARLAAEWIVTECLDEGVAESEDAARPAASSGPGSSGSERAGAGSATSDSGASTAAPGDGATPPRESGTSATITGPDRPVESASDADSEDTDGSDGSDDSDEGEDSDGNERDRGTAPEPTSVEGDAVVENGRFTVELDRTVFDRLQIVDQVASDRHSWTYAAMATVDAETVAVLVRTYRPPAGAPVASFSGALADALERWSAVDDHDGVATVYDHGRRPHPWVVHEFATETVRSVGRLPVADALQVGADAAAGLAHAHDRGVTHGALDPRSLAVHRPGEDRAADDSGRASGTLLNFRVVDGFAAVDGPLPMDSRYAAPELFDRSHGPVDWLTDVYHLGATVYTALTGRPPYAESLVGRGGPADLALDPPSAVADVPEAVDGVVTTAMATRKIARYESADEFARDLSGTLDRLEDQR